MRRVVQVAGRDIALSADDTRRWDAIDALFAGCAESSEAPQITLHFGGRPPALPDRQPDLEFTGVDVWLGIDGAACRTAAGVAARRNGNEVEVGGPIEQPDTAAAAIDLANAFRRSVQHVLADVLAVHGRHTVHAASISHAGWVVIALGGTGAGKSTLAFAASRRGWSVLSDDLTFVTVEGGQVVASGLPKPLNVPGDLLGPGRGGGSAIAHDARDRVRLPLEPLVRPGSSPVAAVIVIEHAAGDGRLVPLAPGPDLLKLLLPSFPLAPDRRRLRDLFPIAAALSRLPAWTLYHDVDPGRRLDVAGTMLDEIAPTLADRQ
jgi:hypothetical protein